METKPDTIQVSATQREDIQAASAWLYISIKGSTLVSGEAALTQAAEVNEMVNELKKAGLPADAVSLRSVDAESTSGTLLPTSSATYHLRLICEDLELFPAILGAVTSHKSTSIEKIEWQYPDEPVIETALEKAILKAEARARKIATALGVRLLGVFDFDKKIHDQEPPSTQVTFGTQGRNRAMGVVSQPDLGMSIQHTKTIEVRVNIEYRVSGFEQA